MQILIDISKDRYDEIMSMDWKNCRRFFDEEIRAIHDGKVLEQEPCDIQKLKVGDTVLVKCKVEAVFTNSQMVMVTTRDCDKGFDAYADELEDYSNTNCLNCVLDRIRAEIDEQYDRVHPYDISCAEGLEMALGIIDKYKAEGSEE